MSADFYKVGANDMQSATTRWQRWGVNYSPSKTLINFADEVFNGSRWQCTYRKKDNGYIRWERADPLD